MENLIGNSIIFGADVLSWIVFVEVPAFFALVLYVIRVSKNLHLCLEEDRALLANKYQILNEKLALYKLEVAQRYASVAYLKDVEARLTNHLIRIEKKLDRGTP